MVNSRGDEVFNPVADKLTELGLSGHVRREVCRVLIDGLQQLGWDTESESLEHYRHDPAIVAAFGDCDVLSESEDPP